MEGWLVLSRMLIVGYVRNPKITKETKIRNSIAIATVNTSLGLLPFFGGLSKQFCLS